jgi:DNA modification methylase
MTIDEWTNDIHAGDAAATLRGMPTSSVHMCMTSPPYFGLRDYGVDGQIGLEDSLERYIESLVDVGRELRRVLRDDGSWWLNLGDSFAGSWGGQSHDADENREAEPTPTKNPARNASLGRKQKMLVPHRVAIALQRDGWVVRNDVTWVKPNPMPQSVKDRLNTTTEQVFHLTANPDYWYDLDAIREPHSEAGKRRSQYGYEASHQSWREGGATPDEYAGTDQDQALHPAGKNPGDVFEVSVRPFPDAHFAVYPPELCKSPIQASCPPKVCVECGAGYMREVNREPVKYEYSERADAVGGRTQSSGTMKQTPTAEHVGWTQSCDCDTDATEPGIVLDPFAGAGTTCLVAKRLGRRFVGIDLNPEYVAMAQKRVGVTVDEPERLLEDGETALTAFAGGGDGHGDHTQQEADR